MFNIIRYSQVVGLSAVGNTTNSHLGNVEEIWLDESGYVTYLSSRQRYWSLNQVASVGRGTISVDRPLLVAAPPHLHHGYQLPVRTKIGETLGWVEDFLFDWHTGEIVAYILAGEIAIYLGERAILLPGDIEKYTPEALIIPEGARNLLKPELEGSKDFICEKSDQVKFLIHEITDRLQRLFSLNDGPDKLQIKIQQVSEDLASTNEYDQRHLAEATELLHDQWASLQHGFNRNLNLAQTALEKAWKEILSQKKL